VPCSGAQIIERESAQVKIFSRTRNNAEGFKFFALVEVKALLSVPNCKLSWSRDFVYLSLT
jgi:hypothetical protein